MNKDDGFSIIIPLYNKQETILKTISTVLNQGVENIEIIVIDDGSTDNSVKLVKSVCDIRVHYHYKNNGGVSSARNMGVHLAKYNWLLFLDADDFLLPNALKLFEKLKEEYVGVKVLVAGFCLNVNNKNIVYPSFFKEKLFKRPNKAFWWGKIFPRTGNTVCHRSVFDNVGLFDENVSFFEDFGWDLRLLSIYNVVYNPQPVLLYNQENRGLSIGDRPIEKEFAYTIRPLSVESFYLKLSLIENTIQCLRLRTRKNDVVAALKYKEILEQKFTKMDICCYFVFDFFKRFYVRYLNFFSNHVKAVV